jgi:uncharacterized membrane protein YbhN (UPF0104 family)
MRTFRAEHCTGPVQGWLQAYPEQGVLLISTTTKKLGLLGIKLTVSTTLLVLVLRKVGLQNMLTNLATMDLRFFFLSSLLYLAMMAFSSLRWRAVLQESPPLRTLFSFCLIGSFFNHFLPGAVGGDALRTYYLFKETGKGGVSFGSVFMDRYIGYGALLTVGLVSGFIAFRELAHLGLQWVPPILFVLFLAGSLIFFGIRIGRRFAAVAGFHDYVHRTIRRRANMAQAFLISIVIQVLAVLEVRVIAQGLGSTISFSHLFVFVPLITTVMAIPISIAGLGLRESAFVVFFGLIGIPSKTSAAIGLLWFLSMAVASLAGVVEYIRVQRSPRPNDRS